MAALMVLALACGNGAEPTSPNDEAPTLAPGVQPAPPAMGMIAPNLRLTIDGVEYTVVEILSADSPAINLADMEVVGTGTLHDPDAAVSVYRSRADGTTDVYTFQPAQTPSKVEGAPPEDEAETTPATWTRWTAK